MFYKYEWIFRKENQNSPNSFCITKLRTKFILVFAILQIEAILRKVHLHQFFYKSCPAHGGRRISFVYWSYNRSFFDSQKRGATIKGIPSDLVKKTKIPLIPLETQRTFFGIVQNL